MEGIAKSSLPVGDKLSMAWDTTKYYFRNSERAQGTAQAVGGALEVAGAVPLSSTGIGATIGVPLAFHGGDNIGTGLSRVIRGEPQETVTFSAVEALSGSRTVARAVDQGLPLLGAAAGAGLYVNSLRLESRVLLDPNQVRYTQATVGFKSSSGYTIDETLDFARAGGELPRVDVVRSSSGELASLDNRRVLVGRQLSEEFNGYGLRATIREFDEALTPAEVERFTLNTKDVSALAKRGFADVNPVPQTWGDAARLRILNQETRSTGRGFSTSNPEGSMIDPKVTGRP
jgi:hypothetical protein